MGVIAFREPEQVWVVAGWAFRQILDDVMDQYPDDFEMEQKFQQAQALDGLHLDLLPPEFASRIAERICRVATGILNGSIQSSVGERYHGTTRPQAYRTGLPSLVRDLGCKDRYPDLE